MADVKVDTRIDSAIDQSAGRLAIRLLRLNYARPEPPTSFRVSNRNLFEWDAPQTKDFTHYVIRIDRDDGDPHLQLSREQRAVQLFVGKRFALSAYNQHTEMESTLVYLDYDAEAAVFGGGAGAASYIDEHAVSGSTYTVTTARAANAGDHLHLFITFSFAGSPALTWNAIFKNPPDPLDVQNGTLSVVSFVGRSSAWYFYAVQTGLATL